MNLSSNAHAIASATRELSGKWQHTQTHWRDAKAQEFEAKYVSELVAGVDRALHVFEELDKIMANIRRECE